MTRVRKVHGRLVVMMGGLPVRVEMRRDGIWFREKHSRRPTRLTFHEAFDGSLGQRLLPLAIESPTPANAGDGAQTMKVGQDRAPAARAPEMAGWAAPAADCVH
jgi:hypothetical protein